MSQSPNRRFFLLATGFTLASQVTPAYAGIFGRRRCRRGRRSQPSASTYSYSVMQACTSTCLQEKIDTIPGTPPIFIYSAVECPSTPVSVPTTEDRPCPEPCSTCNCYLINPPDVPVPDPPMDPTQKVEKTQGRTHKVDLNHVGQKFFQDGLGAYGNKQHNPQANHDKLRIKTKLKGQDRYFQLFWYKDSEIGFGYEVAADNNLDDVTVRPYKGNTNNGFANFGFSLLVKKKGNNDWRHFVVVLKK